VLEFFEHGEREVVETVCLVIFPSISFMEDQVSSLNEKGVKAIVLGPESSDTGVWKTRIANSTNSANSGEQS